MNETETTINPAVLGERLQNLMRAVEDIKKGMDKLATRSEIANLVTQAEHSAVINRIEHRIEKLEGSTPGKLLDTIVKLCLAVSAAAGAGAWVYHVVKGMP